MKHCSQNHTKINKHPLMCLLTQIFTHTHTQADKPCSEPLKAGGLRVIIIHVNSKGPQSGSAGWCWELCPTCPAGYAYPHTASCHSSQLRIGQLSLHRWSVGTSSSKHVSLGGKKSDELPIEACRHLYFCGPYEPYLSRYVCMIQGEVRLITPYVQLKLL